MAIFALFTVFYFTISVAMAQATQPAATVGQSLLTQAQGLVGQLNNGWVMTIGVFVVEFLMRAVKTEDPKSLLYVLESIFTMIATVCNFMGQLLDNVLQRSKNSSPPSK